MEGPPAQQQLSPTEEQERWLHEAFKAVKQHAFYMKRALVRTSLASHVHANPPVSDWARELMHATSTETRSSAAA